MKSEIISYIRGHPNTWRDDLKKLNINIKEDGALAIFNYGVDADFTNPLVREARGIIINLVKLRVCAWPFSKFCNVWEAGAQIDLKDFDWNNCRVEKKIDGSIIKAWWNGVRWQWSTNSCINADDAPTTSGKTFGDIIKQASNYKDIPWNELNKRCTYIFELVSPETQVVIHYPYTKLFHIGTRNNETGEESKVNIGIDWPRVYDIHTLEDCIKAAEELNPGDEITDEGFVVVDKNYHRVKIKNPKYLQLHHAINNGNISKTQILKMIQDKDIKDLDNLGNIRLSVLLKYYDFKMKELEYEISQYIDYVRGLYEEVAHDRKALAIAIRSHRLSAFGFSAVGNDNTASQLLANTKISTLCKLIPDYDGGGLIFE